MLSDILNKNGSDKCQYHSYNYIYDGFLKDYDPQGEWDILEVGVEQGGSLCAWKEHFPNARVTGVDIIDTRLPQFISDDVEFILSDIVSYKPDRKFDIIIEDGNHSNFDALWASVELSKHIKLNGTLIVEDVQEGFMIPFLLWGQLKGGYVVSAIDMRRITNTHDNFAIIIHKWKDWEEEDVKPVQSSKQYTKY